MGSLIKNEFTKIFRKKSTYIVLIVLICFMILTNIIYKFSDKLLNAVVDNRTNEQYIEYAKEELKTTDVNSNKEKYIDLKTDIDYYELYKKYDEKSWQAYIIERDFYNYLRDINIFKYGNAIEKENLIENPEEVYKRELEKLNNWDWKQYVKEEINTIETQLSKDKELRAMAEDVAGTKEIDEKIKNEELQLELAKTRIEKDIPYGKDYLNEAIATRISNANLDYDYNKPDMSYNDKVNTQSLIEQSEKAKYIIEHKQDLNGLDNLRAVLLYSFDEYSIFIVIFIAMIAGGIVSSELEKGTIKMLLVKPYSRGKILLAKYITSMLMILFIFVVTILLELLIGGIIFGFKSISIPAVVYNFNTNSLETYNLFAYVGLLALSKLPMYILLGTLAFTISCVIGSTVMGVVFPIIGNFAFNIITNITYTKQIKQLAFLPTLNWDFSVFMFGRLPQYQHTNIGFASLICSVYLVVMIAITWISFKKKDIKNI